jgi:hypothetical protein
MTCWLTARPTFRSQYCPNSRSIKQMGMYQRAPRRFRTVSELGTALGLGDIGAVTALMKTLLVS